MTMRGPVRGRHAFREYLKTVFKMFPDLRIQTTTCDTGSSLGVAESVMSGTYAGVLGRGRRVSARVACVFEVAGGWLVHERLYLGPRQFHASARPAACLGQRGDNTARHILLNAPGTQSFSQATLVTRVLSRQGPRRGFNITCPAGSRRSQ